MECEFVTEWEGRVECPYACDTREVEADEFTGRLTSFGTVHCELPEGESCPIDGD